MRPAVTDIVGGERGEQDLTDWLRPENWRRLATLPDPLGIRSGFTNAWSQTLRRLLEPTAGRRLKLDTPHGTFTATVSEIDASAPSNWSLPLPLGEGIETIEHLTATLVDARWNDYRIDQITVDVQDIRFTNIPVTTLITGPIELAATLHQDTVDQLIDDADTQVELRADGTIAVRHRLWGMSLTTVGRPHVRDGRAQLDIESTTVFGRRALPLPRAFDLVLSLDLPWWPSALGSGPIDVDGSSMTVRASLQGLRRPLDPEIVMRALDTTDEIVSIELEDAPITVSRGGAQS